MERLGEWSGIRFCSNRVTRLTEVNREHPVQRQREGSEAREAPASQPGISLRQGLHAAAAIPSRHPLPGRCSIHGSRPRRCVGSYRPSDHRIRCLVPSPMPRSWSTTKCTPMGKGQRPTNRKPTARGYGSRKHSLSSGPGHHRADAEETTRLAAPGLEPLPSLQNHRPLGASPATPGATAGERDEQTSKHIQAHYNGVTSAICPICSKIALTTCGG